ncbi:MAG: type I pantothenate kinase [Actinomycetaceae bacterium]|nr:type I pantothenate kinase [Arcanobacterium sp.]MDD7505331.1 type I pantothenate kinase [Actinomycetaceae bacterium]MDY6143929.1 type I pantothenate kinase [Arcanobacterium sp.]
MAVLHHAPRKERAQVSRDAHYSTSPFTQIPLDEWRAFASATELPLTESEVRRLASLGDPITVEQADGIYRPLSALMQIYAGHTSQLREETESVLGVSRERTPWVIGIAGSVAVGKSTAARLLQELMSRWPRTPHVALVPTDGFLYPNARLEQMGLLGRKGFPESYNRHALLEFLAAVKAGEPHLRVPVYDHLSYDIVPDQHIEVDRPEILIVEGLNVLQPPRLSTTDGEFRAVSDYFDFSIYLDASEEALETWYMERFRGLRKTAFSDERSYFRTYSHLSDAEADAVAHNIWQTINLPNLRENVAPTRSRASIVLTKDADHSITEIWLRNL